MKRMQEKWYWIYTIVKRMTIKISTPVPTGFYPIAILTNIGEMRLINAIENANKKSLKLDFCNKNISFINGPK